jgi:capsular exopolysaccharide synthesis family protein
VEQLKLDQMPEFQGLKPSLLSEVRHSITKLLPSPPSVATTSSEEPDRLEPIVDDYLGRLVVTPVPRSRLAKISFEAKDRGLAARIINEHAKQFIEQNLQFKFEATTQASDFLAEQIQGLKATLEKSEDKLQEYSRQNEIIFTEEGKNTATEKLRQLEEEFTRAQADRIDKEALLKQIQADRPELLPQLLTNTLISGLSSQAADLHRQDANLAVTFGPDYPSRLRLRSQIERINHDIDAEKRRVIDTVKAEFGAAGERERLLGAELDQQRTIVNNINQNIIQYNILKREVESNKQIYDGLLTRLKEAGVSAGLRASNIRVVDKGKIPTKPSRPQKAFNFGLSFVIGLLGGIGIAFLQEYLDITIKSPEDITKAVGLPTLAIVPKLASISGKRGYRYGYRYGYGNGPVSGRLKAEVLKTPVTDSPMSKGEIEDDKANKEVELIIHNSPTSLISEAYRSLRTSLLLSAADHPPRCVLVASPLPSEGKTATVVNLAISLTQSGSRTLIIDADMRRPRLHQILKLGDAAGLSSFLTGSAALQDVIHETSIPNLFAIPCGPIPPNPSELIPSSRFSRMMDALRGYFDFVVVDSPPLGHVSDARVLANECEAAVIVVKAASTSRHALNKAVDDLADSRIRVAGVVLNDFDVRSRKGGYSYYYYTYSRYSAYGYGRYGNGQTDKVRTS